MRCMTLLILSIFLSASCCNAEKYQYSLNFYSGQMTTNHFEDFFTEETVNYSKSYLLALSLARTIGHWRNKLSYEVEGQVVKHFNYQNHWEFNLLGVLRWEKFPWDNWLQTSAAFGLGPSWATRRPKIEIENDGETARFMVYWMTELAIAPFSSRPNLELFSRIHHRSDAFGLVADDGGSNALAFGLRYRF